MISGVSKCMIVTIQVMFPISGDEANTYRRAGDERSDFLVIFGFCELCHFVLDFRKCRIEYC